MRTLKYLRDMMRGADVEDFQRLVTEAGFDCGGIDGKYGAKCAAACRAFQKAKGLAVDGKCGPQTWAALEAQTKEPQAPLMGGQALRAQVVAAARKYLGCRESDGSFKKIIDRYNAHTPRARGVKVTYTSAWCATFVSTVAIDCGLTDILPTECSCGRMIELYREMGRWHEDDAYRPQVGDILMYDWDDDGKGDATGWPDHVGIVTDVSGDTITVIEGNKNSAVGYRTVKVNGRYIRGYCLPDYEGRAGADQPKPPVVEPKQRVSRLLKRTSPMMSGEDVKWLQAELKERGYDPRGIDGKFGEDTANAVRAFQRAAGLTVDGKAGKNTITALDGIWAG